MAVSGLGLNWTRLKEQCSGRNLIRLEVWMAQGEPSPDQAGVTAIFSSSPANAVIAVSRYAGVDEAEPLGNVIAVNAVGVDGACAGGVDTSTYSFTLSTTANGTVVYSAVAMRNKNHLAGAGFNTRAHIVQGTLGSAASIAVQDKNVSSPAAVTVDGSFSGSTDWAAVAVEIKPDAGAVTSIDSKVEKPQTGAGLPSAFQLLQNYPNPFNAQTHIEYILPKSAKIRLCIYDIYGQRVRTLVESIQAAGRRRIRWNGRDDRGRELGSGVYLARLETGSQYSTKRIILLK